MTKEELTKARALSSPEIPDDDETAKQPTRQLVRKMLAHIDQVEANSSLYWQGRMSAIEAMNAKDKELHAALDAKEKAEARCGDAYEQMGIANNRIQQEATARMALQCKVSELQVAKEKAEAEAMSWRSKWDIMTHNRNAEQAKVAELRAEVKSEVAACIHHQIARSKADELVRKLQAIVDNNPTDGDRDLEFDKFNDGYPGGTLGEAFDEGWHRALKAKSALSAAASSGEKEKQ